MRRWTKATNLFAYDFILVPINLDLHWSLAVICYPGLLLENVDATHDGREDDGEAGGKDGGKGSGDTTDDETEETHERPKSQIGGGKAVIDDGSEEDEDEVGQDKRLDDDHADGVDDLYVDEDHGEDEQQVVEERVDEYEYSDVEENQRAAMERASSSCTSQRVHSPSKGRTAETSITIDDSDESDGGGGGEEDAEEETIRNTQNPEADAAAAEEAEDAEGAAVPVPVVDEPGRCEEAADTVATNVDHESQEVFDDDDDDDDDDDVVFVQDGDSGRGTSDGRGTPNYNEQPKLYDDEEKFPCILFLDSLNSHDHLKICRYLRSYLNCEAESKGKKGKKQGTLQTLAAMASNSDGADGKEMEDDARENDGEEQENAVAAGESEVATQEDIFTEKSLQAIQTKVPRQKNSWDCGVFLLEYADQIMDLHPTITEYALKVEQCRKQLNEEMFRLQRIKDRRADLKEILIELHRDYFLNRSEEPLIPLGPSSSSSSPSSSSSSSFLSLPPSSSASSVTHASKNGKEISNSGMAALNRFNSRKKSTAPAVIDSLQQEQAGSAVFSPDSDKSPDRSVNPRYDMMSSDSESLDDEPTIHPDRSRKPPWIQDQYYQS